MEAGTSRNVEEAGGSNESSKEKPIMELFRRLVIRDDCKKATELTNEQFMAILKEELMIDVHELHPLETEMYLWVVKAHLKAWPQWDDFDKVIKRLKQRNKTAKIEKTLQEHSVIIKNYLLSMLEHTKPLVKEKVELLKKDYDRNEDNVVLEVHATREQLNSFLYRHPHPEKNYTVFNNVKENPTTISLNMPDLDSILNWWNVKIVINGVVTWTRQTTHQNEHTLVNKKLNLKSSFSRLDTDFEEKANTAVTMEINKSYLIGFFKGIKKLKKGGEFDPLVDTLLEDVQDLPDNVHPGKMYRRYFFKYPYVRYLCTDVPEAKSDAVSMKYDLQVEETIKPRFQVNFNKISVQGSKKGKSNIGDFSVQLQCIECMTTSIDSLKELKEHICLKHMNEPDWQCTNCKQVFSMVTLTKNRWCHDCK